MHAGISYIPTPPPACLPLHYTHQHMTLRRISGLENGWLDGNTSSPRSLSSVHSLSLRFSDATGQEQASASTTQLLLIHLCQIGVSRRQDGWLHDEVWDSGSIDFYSVCFPLDENNVNQTPTTPPNRGGTSAWPQTIKDWVISLILIWLLIILPVQHTHTRLTLTPRGSFTGTYQPKQECLWTVGRTCSLGTERPSTWSQIQGFKVTVLTTNPLCLLTMFLP